MEKKKQCYTPQEYVKRFFTRGYGVPKINRFFYGDFVSIEGSDFERHAVLCKGKSGVIIPVKDWRHGVEMDSHQIRAFAEFFYLEGLIGGHNNTDIKWEED